MHSQAFNTPVKRANAGGDANTSPTKKPVFAHSSVNDVAKLFEDSASGEKKKIALAKTKVGKQGELILCLKHVSGFSSMGSKFTTVAVKIYERKKGNRVVDCWYLNNSDTEQCILEQAAAYYENKIGPIWVQAAMKNLKSATQRKTPFGEADEPLLRKNQYEVSFLYTYVKCGATTDATVARINEFGEFLKLALVRSGETGGNQVCLFVEAYKAAVSPNLLNNLPQTFEQNLMDISVEVREMDTLDELFMDNQIYTAVRYCFQRTDISRENDLQLVSLGWKNPAGHF